MRFINIIIIFLLSALVSCKTTEKSILLDIKNSLDAINKTIANIPETKLDTIYVNVLNKIGLDTLEFHKQLIENINKNNNNLYEMKKSLDSIYYNINKLKYELLNQNELYTLKQSIDSYEKRISQLEKKCCDSEIDSGIAPTPSIMQDSLVIFGVIKNINDEILSDAKIKITLSNGSIYRTITDAAGNYRIKVPFDTLYKVTIIQISNNEIKFESKGNPLRANIIDKGAKKEFNSNIPPKKYSAVIEKPLDSGKKLSNYLTLTPWFSYDILFEKDSFNLPTDKRIFSELDEYMGTFNDYYYLQNIMLHIVGFTSKEGDVNYNDTLSKKRAETIYNYIIGRINRNIKSRLVIVGYGETAGFSKDKNDSYNRRVNIYDIKEK